MKKVFKIIAFVSLIYALFHFLNLLSRFFYIRDDVKGGILLLALIGSVIYDVYVRRKRSEK